MLKFFLYNYYKPIKKKLVLILNSLTKKHIKQYKKFVFNINLKNAQNVYLFKTQDSKRLQKVVEDCPKIQPAHRIKLFFCKFLL